MKQGSPPYHLFKAFVQSRENGLNAYKKVNSFKTTKRIGNNVKVVDSLSSSHVSRLDKSHCFT